MTTLEARIRRRLFGTRWVQVLGPDDVGELFGDEDVVRVRYETHGVRVWTYWTADYAAHRGVTEWFYPWSRATEVRVSRP